MLFSFLGTALLSLVAAGTSPKKPLPYCNATKDADTRVYSCNFQWTVSEGDKPKCPEEAFNGGYAYTCPVAADDDAHCDETYSFEGQTRELRCDQEQKDRPELADCKASQDAGTFVYVCRWNPYTV